MKTKLASSRSIMSSRKAQLVRIANTRDHNRAIGQGAEIKLIRYARLKIIVERIEEEEVLDLGVLIIKRLREH